VSVSKPAVTTALGRGTSGFRAPELLSEEPKYNNKVDIWALACILYQLCTNKPLFLTDFAIREFNNSDLDLSEARIPDVARTHVLACLQEMLAKDPQLRPPASLLKSLFNLYGFISNPIFSEILSISLSYSNWRDLISNVAPAGEPDDIIRLVVDWIFSKEGRDAGAVTSLLKIPTGKLYQAPTILCERLAELYEENCDWSTTITMRKQIITSGYLNDEDLKIQTEKIRGYLQKYPDVFITAVRGGSLQDVKFLLENGADVNAQGHETNGYPLEAAIYRCSKSLVSMLLEKGADVNTQVGHYGNVLQATLAFGDYCGEEIISMLLNKGTDINAQGGYYGNALQAAACVKNKAVVSMLLEKGADINAQGGYYGNALQAAACFENKAVVSMLLEKGADINAQGGLYGNALQAAAESGNKAVVSMLLEKGADVNAQGGYYGNALRAAVCCGKGAVVSMLLENGADVKDVTKNALQAAMSKFKDNEAVMSMLKTN
jgi:ankyrin repeat protein